MHGFVRGILLYAEQGISYIRLTNCEHMRDKRPRIVVIITAVRAVQLVARQGLSVITVWTSHRMTDIFVKFAPISPYHTDMCCMGHE